MEKKCKNVTVLFVIITAVILFWLYRGKTYIRKVQSEHGETQMQTQGYSIFNDNASRPTNLIMPLKVQTQHNKKCGAIDITQLKFRSQSNEDRAIFETFFTNESGPTLCHGTFVEIGALDGQTYSNSLFYEKHLNWSGVLIEGNPALTEELNTNRPETVNFGGLCPCEKDQHEVLFVRNKNPAIGGALDQMSLEHYTTYFKRDNNIIKVPCKPMGEILHEAGVRSVDLFFIDVEGSEYIVIETMDWTIPVHIVMIEMGHSEERDKVIRTYMEDLGFVNTLPKWDIKSFCSEGGDCAPNEVFINPYYPQPLVKPAV